MNIDGLVLLVCAVIIKSVRMYGQVMRVRAAPDNPHDAVDHRIDDVVDVPSVVALKNAHGNAVVRIEARDSLCGRCRGTESDKSQQA